MGWRLFKQRRASAEENKWKKFSRFFSALFSQIFPGSRLLVCSLFVFSLTRFLFELMKAAMFSERQPRSGREVGLTSCLQLGGSLRLEVS